MAVCRKCGYILNKKDTHCRRCDASTNSPYGCLVIIIVALFYLLGASISGEKWGKKDAQTELSQDEKWEIAR